MPTKKQRQTEQFVKKLGRKPTIREVQKRFKLKSTASAWERLSRYEESLKKCPFCNHKINPK